ncbi:MAG: hypothetical protein K6G50_09300 [bacterium]|nr:hypothetical protein [bacterium]
MPKKLFAFLLLFISLTASSWAWKSASWGLSFTEPQGWPSQTTSDSVMFASPGGEGGIGVKYQATGGQEINDEDLDEIYPAVASMFEQLYHGKLLGLHTVNINGKKMMKMSIEVQDEVKLLITGYVAIHNGKTFMFVLTTEPANHNAMMPYLDSMVKSAKFQ